MKQKATSYKANNISLANRCETAFWTEGRVYSSIQLLLVEAIKKMKIRHYYVKSNPTNVEESAIIAV